VSRPLRIFISAGEHSGDSHGAALAKRLRARVPDIHLEGLGGPRMRAAGVALHMDLVEHATMGVLPVIKKLPFFRRVLREVGDALAADPPDVIVPIDYPDFHKRLCARAKMAGAKVCWFVGPQVWASRPWRVKGYARLVDHMMVLFEFETAIWEAAGVPCTFVGHPLFDELRARRPSPAFRAGLGLDPSTPVLGLLPGSRHQEVLRNLPLELRAARLVHAADARVRFAIPVAQPSLRPLVESLVAEHAPGLPVSILDGYASDVARIARAALCASGTATLELLHYDCPMVVVYQATWLQELFVRRLLTTPWIGLVNVLARREICPEFKGVKDFSAEIADAALELLRPGRARKKCLSALEALRRQIDVKGIDGRAADAVLELAASARRLALPGPGAGPRPPRPTPCACSSASA
jgi:lipid-A-disaccharide synthase